MLGREDRDCQGGVDRDCQLGRADIVKEGEQILTGMKERDCQVRR